MHWGATYGGYNPITTIPKQIHTVRRFSRICDMLHPAEQTKVIIDELLKNSRRGVKPVTLNHVEYDLEAWAIFLGQSLNLPRFKESRSAELWIPSDEEVSRIRRQPNREIDPAMRSRNKCIIDLLFASGIRIGELIQLNLGDLEGNLLTVKSEKGEATRVLGLPRFLVKQLEDYLRLFRYSSDPYSLFTTRRGRLNYNYARNLVKKIASDAGVPKFHAHVARHWCATTLLRRSSNGKGLDIRAVQIHLGHASLASTQRYTHLRGKEVVEQVVERMDDFFGDEE